MTDKPAYALGVEIGGTKLQIGLGSLASETIEQLWRADIDADQGALRIRSILRRVSTNSFPARFTT